MIIGGRHIIVVIIINGIIISIMFITIIVTISYHIMSNNSINKHVIKTMQLLQLRPLN